MEFEEGDLQEVVASSPAEEAAELSSAKGKGKSAKATKRERTLKNILRDRIAYYVGLILVAIGGPGLTLGSWLHDLLNVPIIGYKYEMFGIINVRFAIIGLTLFIIGIVLLAVSLRGGVVSKEELKNLKAGGSDA